MRRPQIKKRRLGSREHCKGKSEQKAGEKNMFANASINADNPNTKNRVSGIRDQDGAGGVSRGEEGVGKFR
jgi:hypothetical protein